MLFPIAIVLIVLWLLGMLTAYTLSGALHLLLVVAVLIILLNLLQGKNPGA